MDLLKTYMTAMIDATSDADTYVLAREFQCAGLITSGTADSIITNKSLDRNSRASTMFRAIQKSPLAPIEVLQKVASVLYKQEDQALIEIARKLCNIYGTCVVFYYP